MAERGNSSRDCSGELLIRGVSSADIRSTELLTEGAGHISGQVAFSLSRLVLLTVNAGTDTTAFERRVRSDAGASKLMVGSLVRTATDAADN